MTSSAVLSSLSHVARAHRLFLLARCVEAKSDPEEVLLHRAAEVAADVADYFEERALLTKAIEGQP